MRVFHRTDAAAEIIRDGFRDGVGRYMTDQEHAGVWVSSEPLDCNSGAFGDEVLTLEIPDDLFSRYEWVEEGKGYRESLIPAAMLNAIGRPEIYAE